LRNTSRQKKFALESRQIAWKAFAALPLAWRRQILFVRAHHRWLNLENPQSFNEKVNWRMVFDRRDSLAWTCDKMRMKEHASAACAEVKVPQTLWSGSDLQELRTYPFPSKWILKPNHGSQDVIIGAGSPDIDELVKKTQGWLQDHLGAERGEWAYSLARALYVLEEWIGDGNNAPTDYKCFVFDGKVRIIQVDTDRFTGHKMAIYTPTWERLKVSKPLHGAPIDHKRPANLGVMISAAEAIASEFDFMRIDFFDTPHGVYFGETTPYPGSGLSPFSPKAYDYVLGSYWNLPALTSIS
jgi:hypothetical protein